MSIHNKIAPFLALALLAVFVHSALALIFGGTGNDPLDDPGWPEGGADIFNTPHRVAYWEGPPFGGGQWHAECRGDAKALSTVLADFAKLGVKSKQVILHDGAGHSFWLAPNREPEKLQAAKIDWAFMVWVPKSWEFQRGLSADLNATGGKDEDGPPAQIEVYTGGNVRWKDVVVPKGLKIVDQRLEAHGFTIADGIVLEGKVTAQTTGKPLAAKMRLEAVKPQAKGGYAHPVIAGANADASGHWVLKNAPGGWTRVVVEADGFVPRVVGYANYDGQPCWQEYITNLATPGPVSGRVVDEDGRPLAGADVHISDVVAQDGKYEAPTEYRCKTNDDGQFRADLVPVGKGTFWSYKQGYARSGLGAPITMPQAGVELRLLKAAKVVVTVDFTGKERPAAYVVHCEPEGGNRVGSFDGSGNINERNQIIYDNVRPGRYVFKGRPNPGSDNQETAPVTVELKGGETSEVRLLAR
jgi:hypothetical protein